MAKSKGKVNEQSLEALKKSIKAGGQKKGKKETKTVAAPKASRSKSRSRSRTPGRTQKKVSPKPVKEKKTPGRKPAAAAKEGKVKRLDGEKSAAKKRASEKKKAEVGEGASTKTYRLRTRTQPSGDQEISSSTKIHDESVMEINDVSSSAKVKSGEQVGAGSQGWFSKCIIS